MTARLLIAALLLLARVPIASAQAADVTVVTGVRAGGVHGDPNTMVADYVYFPDPLNRAFVLAGAAIDIPSTRDRLAAIVGAAVVPAGGLGVGLSGALARGFGITAGAAWLLVNAPKDGLRIGDVPTDLRDPNPFEAGVARTWFVGVNYMFRRGR